MIDFARDHLSPIDYERITASITESTLYGNRVASGVQARQPLCFETTLLATAIVGAAARNSTTENACMMSIFGHPAVPIAQENPQLVSRRETTSDLTSSER